MRKSASRKQAESKKRISREQVGNKLSLRYEYEEKVRETGGGAGEGRP
jgi:hypothetical protein